MIGRMITGSIFCGIVLYLVSADQILMPHLDAQLIGSAGLDSNNQAQAFSDNQVQVTQFEPLSLNEGLLESQALENNQGVEVRVDDRADKILDAKTPLRSSTASASGTIAGIITSEGNSTARLIQNTPSFGIGKKRNQRVISPIVRRPVASERVPLQGHASSVVQTANTDSDVVLIAQAPLIDEPLGSGLATPVVLRGGALPPPVIFERVPTSIKSQEAYEILPPPNSDASEVVPGIPSTSDLGLEEDSVIWMEAETQPKQQATRRRRMLRQFGQRMEPLRPINLCDRGLYFATEFTFLSSSQVAKSEVSVTDMLIDVEQSIESEGAFGYGQRGILGLQGEVFGFEAIYWDYGSRGYESGSWKPPYLFEQYTTGQSVDLSTLDLQVTQRFCIGGLNLGTALGIRKLDYVGHSSAFSLASYHDEKIEVSSSALAKNRLEGVGPTFAIRGRRPFHTLCDVGSYGVGMFWDTRLSWLWADASSSAITEATAVSTTAASPTVSRSLDYAYTISDDPKLRMHFGLQYGFECWRSVGKRSRLISRAAFEYQYFEQSDDYSMASSYAFLTDSVNFGGASSALAENAGKDLNMFGFTLLLGINY